MKQQTYPNGYQQRQVSKISKISSKNRHSQVKTGNNKYIHNPQIINHQAIYQKSSKKSIIQKFPSKMQIKMQIIQWQALYFDKAFYLAQPQTIKRLQQLQAMIKLQKQKLLLQNELNQFHQTSSVHSHQLHKFNNYCNLGSKTQINESFTIKKQKETEQQLHQYEDQFKQYVKQMKKKQYEGDSKLDKNIQFQYNKMKKMKQLRPKQRQYCNINKQEDCKSVSINQQKNQQYHQIVKQKTIEKKQQIQSKKFKVQRSQQSQGKNNINNHNNKSISKQQNTKNQQNYSKISKKQQSQNLYKRQQEQLQHQQQKFQHIHPIKQQQYISPKFNTLKQDIRQPKQQKQKKSFVVHHKKSNTNTDRQLSTNNRYENKSIQASKISYSNSHYDKVIRNSINYNYNHKSISKCGTNKIVNSIANEQKQSLKLKYPIGEFEKLYEKLQLMQEKLCKIEQKQQHIEKIEKSYHFNNTQNFYNKSQQLMQRDNSTNIKQLPSMILPKLSTNFQLNSNILSINTAQQHQQQQKRKQEIQEKQQLKQEINHLRKTIRQLKLEKILQQEQFHTKRQKQCFQKSRFSERRQSAQIVKNSGKHFLKDENIEMEQKLQSSRTYAVQRDPDQSSELPNPTFHPKIKNTMPISISLANQAKQQQSQRLNDRHIIDMGKIVKNSPEKYNTINSNSVKKQFIIKQINNHSNLTDSKKRQQQIIKSRIVVQNGSDSRHSKSKVSQASEPPKKCNDTSKAMAINKPIKHFKQQFTQPIVDSKKLQQDLNVFLDLKQKTLESRGIQINKIDQHHRYEIENQNDEQDLTDRSQIEGKKIFELQFSKPKKKQIKVIKLNPKIQINYNYQQQQPQQQRQIKSVSQIKITQLQFPEIPNTPTLTMQSQQLNDLALITFKLFNVKIIDPQALKMTKYKNCILFATQKCEKKILWHYSGKFYLGDWKNTSNSDDSKHGEGFQYVPFKYMFKGQFYDGKKNGFGIMKNHNGSIYEGQWMNGNRHGGGKYYDSISKSSYDGEWKDNKKQGFGTLRLSEKQYYIGTFQQSVKHGHGIESYQNGDKYKGQYENGKFHGKGKYFWANGSSYEGNFHQGYRQGHGIWKSSRNRGDSYIGQYIKDKKEGYGRYIWSNGCCYEGNFKEDKKHGDGRMIYEDGRQLKGNWIFGKIYELDGQLIDTNNEEQSMKNSSKNIDHIMNSKLQEQQQNSHTNILLTKKKIGMIMERPSKQVQKSKGFHQF